MFHPDIDTLVQSILDDLTIVPAKEPAPLSKPTPKEPEAKSNEIFIDSRVVSLADIKSRLGDAKKLIISPKSILTPSAKDEIRKRKIEVAVRLPNLAADRRPALWLAAQRPAVFSSEVLKRFEVKPKSFETAEAFVDEAVKRAAGRCGIALSRQAATLLCELNRHEEIRAVTGFEPKQTAEDAAEIDANLLVLHPERTGRRMVEIIDFFIQCKTV